MKRGYIIIIPLTVLFIFAFYAGKYYAWEKDPSKETSTGSFFKDWHVAGILAIIVAVGITFRTVHKEYVK